MAGLLLINFEQDPDTVYHGFEPQFFANALFELGPDGVQVDIVFRDLQGRPVHLVVRVFNLYSTIAISVSGIFAYGRRRQYDENRQEKTQLSKLHRLPL